MAFDPGGFSSEFGPGTAPAPPEFTLDPAASPMVLQNFGALSSIYLQSALGTQAAPNPIPADFGIGQLVARGFDGSAYGAYDAALYFRATETHSPAGHGTEVLFYSTPNGSITAANSAGVSQGGSLWCGGPGVLPTNATDGFFGTPAMAGAPTGVPVINYATAPMVFDTADKQLWVYGGGWNALATLGQPANFTTLTLTGGLTVSNSAASQTVPVVAADGAPGTFRGYFLTSAGVPRWSFGTNGVAESGSNAGSDLVIRALSDAGANLFAAFTIVRATGQATFNNGLILGGTTNHGVLVSGGNGNNIVSAGPGTTGQVLTSQGAAADPTYTSAAAGSTGSAGQNPAAPATTTTTMAGLGAVCSFTPTRNGRVLVMFHGHVTIAAGSPAGAGIFNNMAYGTGTPPANGAAFTGTQAAPSQRAWAGVAVTANDYRPFMIAASLTGLVVGTTYWVDLGQALALAGAPVSTQNVVFNYSEQ